MKVLCDRGALVDALNLVSGVVVSRTPRPVLRCVKVSAADKHLTLAATDLEASVKVTTPHVEVQEAGEALIPCEKLNQIVRESVDATLRLEVDKDVAHIRGDDSHFQIYGQPVADFPPVAQFSGEADFQIGAGDLSQLIARTVFAAARENSRYAMNGVLVEREGKKLSVVATDGRRLALAKGTCVPDESAADGRHEAIVPTRALGMLQRLFDDAEQQVRVRIADNTVVFATDTAVLSSNLVEGNFPPYRDVIPQDTDTKVTLNTEVFARAVRRAALLTNEESKGIRIAFAANGLTLSSRAPEMGEAEIHADVVGYDGQSLEIGFNPVFILDALKVTDADEVVVDLKAANKPGLIRSGSEFLYVIMPVNLS